MSTIFAETKLKTLRKDYTSRIAEYEALKDEVRKVAETKLKALLKDYTILIKQYEALKDEVRKETNPSTRVTLELRIDELDEKIPELERKIEDAQKSSPDPIVNERAWKSKLPEIDFKDANDPSIRVKLELRIHELNQEIPELERKIQDAEKSSPDPIVNERAWKSKLPEIDFKDAIDTYKAVLAKMERDCGAALFLMQDGTASAASLCVARMVAELRRPLGLVLHPRFSGATPSPRELMQKLAGYLNVAPDRDADALAADVVRSLVDSLTPGRIVWLDLECDSATNAAEFLGWFLEKFWCPLVQALSGRAGAARFAQVFAVIVYNVPMDAGRLEADWLCGPDTFHARRFVRVPLEPAWRLSDPAALVKLKQRLGELAAELEKVEAELAATR